MRCNNPYLFIFFFSAIPDDAPVLEESDNEEDMEPDRRISSEYFFLSSCHFLRETIKSMSLRFHCSLQCLLTALTF